MNSEILSPQQRQLQRRLSELALRLRTPRSCQFVYDQLLNDDERHRVEIPRKEVLPDLIGLWSELRQISPVRAVLDLAYQMDAILPNEYARLVKQVEAEEGILAPAPLEPSPSSRRPRFDNRAFSPAKLFDRHTHDTHTGIAVHIWQRAGRFLARGSYEGRRFGVDLGADVKLAEAELRNLLVSIEAETFVRPSVAKKQKVKQRAVARRSIEQIRDLYIPDVRKRKGTKTARSYADRLDPLIRFAAEKSNKQSWPTAADVDRDFVMAFRAWLFNRKSTRNGHPASCEIQLSARQVFNVLDCCRTMFRWAASIDVKYLPAELRNPFTKALIGERPRKDPVRKNRFPLTDRIALVNVMDAWELSQIGLALVLPQRPDEFSALLVSDVDFEQKELKFGTRLGGGDFTKGRLAFHIPFPSDLESLLRRCVAGRAEGPLFLKATPATRKTGRRSLLQVESTADLEQCFVEYRAAAKPGEIQAEQDLKRLYRKMLVDLGGLSSGRQRAVFQEVLSRSGLSAARRYDLRGAITTDMQESGISEIALRYLTGHAVRDILAEYVGIDPHREMSKYFQNIQPLLTAICDRARHFGIAS